MQRGAIGRRGLAMVVLPRLPSSLSISPWSRQLPVIGPALMSCTVMLASTDRQFNKLLFNFSSSENLEDEEVSRELVAFGAEAEGGDEGLRRSSATEGGSDVVGVTENITSPSFSLFVGLFLSLFRGIAAEDEEGKEEGKDPLPTCGKDMSTS